MSQNLHLIERILRVIVGAFLVSLIFWGPQNFWFAFGGIFVVTGIVGVCPIYSIFGFSTCAWNADDSQTED